ncbi:choice-of-anchor A family protein [Nocardioides sp. zg-579]|uniref:Choice-of-anchor A family protein n=1 Tax=Nocardioides marmotae TaxID=2663857 RepID=A0A6I3JDC0_9ACTN|nr:collagen-binding domain-containing protein [Nocardioides marmotae]MCR6032404.1 choice-of-anchor A family protein [Gordonia jinghuaiqii]MTB96053.1 choice-of-anchor A family protein [Nocardioides marmotae]QKE02625.1 choice-of-anchor A family protein [Nocardioides marmotae]
MRRAGVRGLIGAALAALVVPLGVVGAAATEGGGAGGGGGSGSGGSGTACVEVENPFGEATGWTEFVEGDGVRHGQESEGTIAYGGDLPVSGMPVGGWLQGRLPKTAPALVVAGRAGSFSLNAGSAWVGPGQAPSHKIDFNSGGGLLPQNPVDFVAGFAHLRALSTSLGAAADTGAVVEQSDVQNRILVLRGDDPRLNVVSLPQALLSTAKTITYDVPAGSALVVNVRGTTVTTPEEVKNNLTPGVQPSTAGVQARGPVIWNFPEATSVAFRFGSDLGGHVLAPRAAVHARNVIIGQVVAASFESHNETHVAFLPARVCLPGTPTAPPVQPPARPDVTVTKTASTATPVGGSTLTWTLTATNVGTAPAPGTVVTDVLPAGVTPGALPAGCTLAGRTVTCAAGTLAPGASASYALVVVVDPVAGAGAPANRWLLHELTPTKQEQHVDLEAGELRTVTASCAAPDALVSDGQVRVDHVDQGTGDLTDVRVLRSEATGPGTWKAVVRNEATGRAQAKLFLVCLPGSTEVTDGHRHALSLDPVAVTATPSWAAGRHSAVLTCPVGTAPVAPGFALAGGAARWSGSEPEGRAGWRFTFDVTDPATAALSLRCLRREVAAAQGHTHDLRLAHVVRTVTVPPGAVVEEQVTCADDAKGIVATWSLPPGVVHLGNDPRLKTRAFRLLNTTGAPLSAVLDLECLGDRPGEEVRGHDQPVVVTNTATVTTTGDDVNRTNDTATSVVTVTPGAGTAALAPQAVLAAKGVRLRVVSSMPGTARLVVSAGGRVLGRARVALRPGRTSPATVTLDRAGRRALAAAGRATVRLDPARGPSVRRTVRLR